MINGPLRRGGKEPYYKVNHEIAKNELIYVKWVEDDSYCELVSSATSSQQRKTWQKVLNNN